MTIAWSSSGTFGNSLPSDPPSQFSAISRGQTIFTVPPGTYGPLARLVVVMNGTGDNSIASSPGLALTSPSGHLSAQSIPGGNPTAKVGNTSGPTTMWWAVGYYTQSSNPQPGDTSFWDGGFSVVATSSWSTVFKLTGTLSSLITTPNISGVGTKFLTELAPGQRITAPGFFAGTGPTILSIADDTHLVVNSNAPSTSTGPLNSTPAAVSESISWLAMIISFDPAVYTTAPLGSGISSSFDGSNPVLLNKNNNDGFSATSLASSFGPVVTDQVSTFDTVLTDGTTGDFGCVDCLSIVQGYTSSTPPFSTDLVVGNANWDAVGSISTLGPTAGIGTQYSAFSSVAHWTRPDPYDTSFAWSAIPVTPSLGGGGGEHGGFCRMWLFPRFPGSGGLGPRSRAYVIG